MTVSETKRHPSFLGKVFYLALPFGKRKMMFVFGLVLVQGLFQVAGVASIFPFLTLAADPQGFSNSQLGRMILAWLPVMDNDQLLTVAGIFSAVTLVASNLVNIASEYVRNRYAHNFGHWMRLRLLNRVLDQPYSYFLEYNSGVLYKKVLNDVMGYVKGILLPLLEAVARAVTAIMLIVTLLFIHVKIALAAAILIGGFYLVVYLFFNKKRATISHELKHSRRRCAVELLQLLGGIKPIKVHEVEQHFVDDLAGHSRTVAKHSSLLPVIAALPRYAVEPLAFSGIIAFVVYLNLRGHDIAAILPTVCLMAFAGFRLLPSIQLLYAQLTMVSAARYTIEEVYDEFAMAQGVAPRMIQRNIAPLVWNRAIQIKNLTFRYPNAEDPVFNGVSLEIPKNSSIAFVGTTGCGKSTLIDLITGLHAPLHGEILIDGTPLGVENLSAWKATIGYVPQDVFLTDNTIGQNIAFGIAPEKVDQDRLRKASSAAQISQFIENELPNGFDTMVGERGVRLSGGQRQRIALTRALYRDASVLILDEATSALDDNTETELMLAINELSHQKTIVMIAHRLSTVRNCDQIFVVENGEIHLAAPTTVGKELTVQCLK